MAENLDGLFENMRGQIVVLDTQGTILYVGTLEAVAGDCLVLVNADVHDSTESRASKELYLLETRELGVRTNRRRVVVDRRVIISASLLTDVTETAE